MTETETDNICRLCLGSKDLIWIFDDIMAANMTEIIQVTCGVEIQRTDLVTQKVCGTCCQITLKMFKFRHNAIKHDMDLKTRLVQKNIFQIRQQNKSFKEELIRPKPPSEPPSIDPKYKFAHPSIRSILRTNPSIILPDIPLRSHFKPYITLLTDEVDMWFQDRDYTESEIQGIKRIAYEKYKSRNVWKNHESNNQRFKSVESKQHPDNATDLSRRRSDSCSYTNNSMNPNKRIKLNSSIIIKPAQETIHKVNGAEDNCDIPIRPQSRSNSKGDHRIGSESRSDLKDGNSARSSSSSEKTRPQSTIAKPDRKDENRVRSRFSSSNERTRPQSTLPYLTIRKSPQRSPAPRRKLTARKTTRPLTYDEEFLSHYSVKANQKRTKKLLSTSSEESARNEIVQNSLKSNIDTFVHSLDLTSAQPGDVSSITLESLLISRNAKESLLYQCKVCDSHHSSLKELKYHEKRTHTKCPLCNKRFRTVPERDEHVKANKCCSVSNSQAKKEMKLELMRANEDLELRKKYPSAFEPIESSDDEFAFDNGGDVSDNNGDVSDSRDDEDADIQNVDEAPNQIEVNVEVANVVRQLEKQLEEETRKTHVATPAGQKDSFSGSKANDSTQNKDRKKQISKKTNAKEIDGPNVDIICISDDEGVNDGLISESDNRINVFNKDLLKGVSLHDNDVDVVKSVLEEINKRQAAAGITIEALKNNIISDGIAPKTKTFKDLRKHLYKYKIMVEITYSPDLEIDYKYANPDKQNKVFDLWYNLIPTDAKPYLPAGPNTTSTTTTASTFTLSNETSTFTASTDSTTAAIITTDPSISGLTSNSTDGNIVPAFSSNFMNSDSITNFPGSFQALQSKSGTLVAATNRLVLTNVTAPVYQTTSNPPIILNSFITSIGISSPLITLSTTHAPLSSPLITLSTTPAPLPVIESVVSNADVDAPKAAAIRVKNLSELS